jgi:hypothetical protein
MLLHQSSVNNKINPMPLKLVAIIQKLSFIIPFIISFMLLISWSKLIKIIHFIKNIFTQDEIDEESALYDKLIIFICIFFICIILEKLFIYIIIILDKLFFKILQNNQNEGKNSQPKNEELENPFQNADTKQEEEINRLKLTINELNDTIKNQQIESNNSMQKLKENIRNEVAILNKAADEKDKKITSIKEQLSQKDLEYKQLFENNQKIKLELEKSQKFDEEQLSTKKKLQLKHNQLEDEINKMHENEKQMKSEISKIQGQLEQEQINQQKIKEQITKLQQEKDQIENQLEQFKIDKERRIQQLTNDKNQLQAQLDQLSNMKNELKTVNQKNQNLIKKIPNLNNQTLLNRELEQIDKDLKTQCVEKDCLKQHCHLKANANEENNIFDSFTHKLGYYIKKAMSTPNAPEGTKEAKNENIMKTDDKALNPEIDKLRLVTTQIYKYDEKNQTPFSDYIDEHPNVLICVKIANINTIMGFSKAPFKPKTDVNYLPGFIASFHNGKIFTMKKGPTKQGQKTLPKPMTYDEYFIMLGNSDIRIKSGTKEIFTAYATDTSSFEEVKNKEPSCGDFFNSVDRDLDLKKHVFYYELYTCHVEDDDGNKYIFSDDGTQLLPLIFNVETNRYIVDKDKKHMPFNEI